MVGFSPAASLLTISPLGEVSTFHILFHTVCNLSGEWTRRRGTNEREALGVWTGTFHSSFQSGRGTDQSLSLPPEQKENLKQSCSTVVSCQKNKLKNGAQGRCNPQTYRLVHDMYHRKISRGKSSKRSFKEGRLVGKGFQEVDQTRHWSTLKAAELRQWCSWPKRAYAFFLKIFRKNAYALFGQPNRQAMQINTTKRYHFAAVRRAILTKCTNQKCRTGRGEKGWLFRGRWECKLPMATLEKCIVFPKWSKKQSYRAYSTSIHGRIPWEHQKSTEHRHPNV